MCGFAAVFGRAADVSDQTLWRMSDTLRHRGPDDAGVWRDPSAHIGLVHARLSVVDLSPAGHQPMISKSGRLVMAFNGEIYNHQALRAELARDRHDVNWRGHADTETLLAGFEAWGIEATVKKTVGMFAFAVWDAETRTLTLGRDRLGEKPLYYGWQGETFLCASELKALRAYPGFTAEIDRDAVAAFLRYSYIPAPYSIYRRVQKLLPGTLLSVRLDADCQPQPVSYWSLLDVARRGLAQPFSGSDADAVSGLNTCLSEAVTAQQMSDVPLGAFLSGGIDSSLVVALMQAGASRPVHSFTIGFSDAQYDESVAARAVARHLGTEHTDLRVTPDEAMAVIARLPSLYDEPFADSSQIPTFLVSQLARRSVTVSLSGDGGDELFGGYNRYQWIGKVKRIPRAARGLLAAAGTALSPSQWDAVYAAARPLLPASLQLRTPGDKVHKLASVLSVRTDADAYRRLVSTWRDPDMLLVRGHDRTDVRQIWDTLSDMDSVEHRMMALDALTYLPDDILCKVDRAAMGVSLETRVPFLDHRVVEYAWRLPLSMKIRNGQGKWILRRLLDRYVPSALIDRPKAGFGVPVGDWLRGPLRAWAESLLGETRLQQEGYFNPSLIRARWAEHLSGTRNWQPELWTVLMFQAWLAEQA